MVLTIDIGNTRTKGAVFEYDALVWQFVTTENDWQKKVSETLEKFLNITDLVVASVGKTQKEALEIFRDRVKLRFISHETTFPFENKYATPTTLGIDRMVLAAGSVLQFPQQNRLVIDAGTCITYDYTDSNDNYLGGAISPGIRLRYEALHAYTARLPLLETEFPNDMIGDSTAQAIHSGVVNGVMNEIDGFIDSCRDRWPNFIIILTGGDAEFLAKRLKNTIFANPNFLLESLYRTFQFSLND
ncbi:type III pantothenate kinase [Flavobacterium sp. MAH-1]|uniref:Type III pantothenate kinase n=1 Tax=Flavobacterium agri TaxID=2743471 RepID=A0A7Y8Y4R8_9FLAO|nr:type III pantothenate kinase [Flavobacterium agri]NUY82509.1 type III pantothenate kinase [Flavobacterium agri]NYA72533.1 type III pantothenate kinase [Flavobacterium agri]